MNGARSAVSGDDGRSAVTCVILITIAAGILVLSMPSAANSTLFFFRWLAASSSQAAALVIFIFVLLRIFRRHLTPKWRCRIWVLVIIRLTLPVSFESTANILGWFAASDSSTEVVEAVGTTDLMDETESPPSPSEATQEEFAEQLSRFAATSWPAPGEESAQAGKPVAAPGVLGLPRWAHWLAWTWLAGALILAAHVAIRWHKLVQGLHLLEPIYDPHLLGLLEDCKRRLGVTVPIQVLGLDSPCSPVLCGFLRPRLLVPRAMLAGLHETELRHLLSHEVAHVKRGDIALNWLTTGLQILHWFNPLIWLAFRLLRTDREMACDALVLSSASVEERKSYARTMIKLVEQYAAEAPAQPGFAGIIEEQQELPGRIRMIGALDRLPTRPLAAIPIIGALALTCLTNPPRAFLLGPTMEQGGGQEVVSVASGFQDPARHDGWSETYGLKILGSSATQPNHGASRLFDGLKYIEGIDVPAGGENVGCLLFADGDQAGVVDWVEWETLHPVTVRAFNLIAFHDESEQSYRRAATEFHLYGYEAAKNRYVSLYRGVLPSPYGSETHLRTLYLMRDLREPFTGRRFRAEFVRDSSGAGPRLVELDALSSHYRVGEHYNWSAHFFGGHLHHCFDPAGAPDADPDDDGVSNEDEFVNRTEPVDPRTRRHLNDAWDVHRGAVVTATSGVLEEFTDLDAMFGKFSWTKSSAEQCGTIFADGESAGYHHWVEFRTPQPVEIRSFELEVGATSLRTAREFRLLIKRNTSGPYREVYREQLPLPYPTELPSRGRHLVLKRNLKAPITASDFRAEFVQAQDGKYQGPRVLELNGFSVMFEDLLPDSWQQEHFGPAFMTDSNANPDADPDGDGLVNRQEHAAGSNPNVPD